MSSLGSQTEFRLAEQGSSAVISSARFVPCLQDICLKKTVTEEKKKKKLHGIWLMRGLLSRGYNLMVDLLIYKPFFIHLLYQSPAAVGKPHVCERLMALCIKSASDVSWKSKKPLFHQSERFVYIVHCPCCYQTWPLESQNHTESNFNIGPKKLN